MKKLLRMGSVPARVRVGQAFGIAPTERLKLRGQMTAAASKKESVSLSLFREVKNLEVEEELCHHGHALLGGEVSGWEDGREKKQIFRSAGLEAEYCFGTSSGS